MESKVDWQHFSGNGKIIISVFGIHYKTFIIVKGFGTKEVVICDPHESHRNLLLIDVHLLQSAATNLKGSRMKKENTVPRQILYSLAVWWVQG